MNDLTWLEACTLLAGLIVVLCAAFVAAQELWAKWQRHKRLKALRILYRDLNDHRITPQFNLKDYK